MPTYEFRCPTGHDFEKFYKSISAAESEVKCPECGEIAARQVSAGAGLVFKGSGFYITDYGKDGKKDQRDAAAKSANTPKATDSAAGAKTDSGSSSASPSSSSPSSSSSSSDSSSKPKT